MISKTLTKALEENGFTYHEGNTSDKSHAFAVYGGYLITVFEVNGKKTAYINFRFADNEENDLIKYNLSESFSSSLEEYSVVDYSISEDGMRVYSNGSVAVFLKLIDHCVSLLLEHGIKGVEYCSECGNKFGSRKPKKVTDGNENRLMCEHCALEYVEEANQLYQTKAAENAKGTVLYGILGSIGFGFIGFLLYFVLYYFLSPALSQMKISINEIRYIFCVAGFAVSTLCYYGYRIFCKKASIAAYVTVPLVAGVFTAIGQYVGVVFEFVAKSGFALSALKNKSVWLIHLRNTIPDEVSNLFTDYSAIFWKLLVISLLFAAVGSAMFLLSLHDKATVKPDPIKVETITIN